uniref:Transposase n=1 Tax=Candidatus Kentrum sp. TC TaxID=2126339 RepID=A0A450ZFB3_9GAMM|nr:MAG: Putative transposase [Candidatus Kentron sp. TC]
METISKGHFTLERIFEDSWEQFFSNPRSEVGFPLLTMFCLEGHEPSRAGRSWVCFSQPSRSNYTHPQKEQGFLSTLTILHIFGTDLKRHVHIHFIVSSGGLKLSGKAERLTKYVKRKATNRRTREKRVIVLVDEPSWVR